ncbi:Peptidase M1 membrane alanine aminopeptidase, partial [mine drainage metagenome]
AARTVSEIPEYRLRLEVDFDTGAWDGHVTFDPTGPARTLDLNADGLTIRSVTAGGRPVPFEYRATEGRLSFPVAGDGGGPVSIEFSGAVQPGQLIGLYRCRHGDGHLLTTQCEPVGARRIFPCVDRPDQKARIHLQVRTGAGLEVISNTPEASTTPAEGGWIDHGFPPTPPMATYLFYLGIGRFDRAEERGGRVAVRVLTAPGRGRSGGFAAGAGPSHPGGVRGVLRDPPYRLPKLDLLAVADH